MFLGRTKGVLQMSDKKILCIGDSLGKPRGRPSLVRLEDTWPKLLAKNLRGHQIIRNFNPSKQSKDIVEEVQNDSLCYYADIIIVQVGVVELYPRCLKRIELEIIKRLPLVRNMWKYLVSAYRPQIIKFRKKSYGSPSRYIENLLEFEKLNLGTKIIFIPPLPHPPDFERFHSPGYNAVIGEVIKNDIFARYFDSEFINLYANTDALMVEDGHHLSVAGHRTLAAKLIKICEAL